MDCSFCCLSISLKVTLYSCQSKPAHQFFCIFIHLANLPSCNDLMVSLYCGLNLLFNVVKSPSIVLHLPCSICVNNSRNCKPLLSSQFFMIAVCSTCGMLYNFKILFTSSLRFLSPLHFSFTSQLNVGCSIMGPPSLGPKFCVLSALTRAMTCIAAHVASATGCAIASLVYVCSIIIICLCTLSAYFCL